MQFTEKLKEIGQALPLGYKKRIAKEAGVTQVTVTRFFQGKVKKKDVLDKCIEATVNAYKEHLATQNSILSL